MKTSVRFGGALTGGGEVIQSLQKRAQLVSQLHPGSYEIVAPAHQVAQGADFIALRCERLEAIPIGAQQRTGRHVASADCPPPWTNLLHRKGMRCRTEKVGQ